MQLYRDPWAKREAWRKHPMFSGRSYFRQMFPGFGIAAVTFGLYVAWDEWRLSRAHAKAGGHGHGQGHAEGHH